MNFEDWLNENCEAKDFSEESNQVNDFLHTSDVIKYVSNYIKYLQLSRYTYFKHTNESGVAYDNFKDTYIIVDGNDI